MNVYNENIVRLIRLYLAGSISDEEKTVLESWVEEREENRCFFKEMLRDNRFASEFPEFRDIDMEKGWSCFLNRTQVRKPKLFTRVLKYVAAVVIPVAIGLAVWLAGKDVTLAPQQIGGVICPGMNKATLILSDGVKVSLGKSEVREIRLEEGRRVRRTEGGLVYEDGGNGKKIELNYNTLQIPKGGEFHLTLSDGTQVTLNSATDLRYPVIFDENERRVFLSGEAYFEVATDSTRPFYVMTDEVQVQVYGTSFNVNTRRPEGIQTVLESGKVGIKAIRSGNECVLKPGELACFDPKDGSMAIRQVDPRQYLAWVKGVFAFEDETLENIMTTLSLWYDVEVFYQTESVKQLHFSGYLGRYKEIQNIFDVITESTGVLFSVKGRTIVISR
ncbi:FecR family protein [Butyricimonas hominis]|uniref:FecR domain-containing protein n=1 Tax=Butyricimonas hominis TaxID=2763032 RepID=A0ABR7D696_9BACT|nr:FecR family protein [Butyricimonas hominis]MBC5623476.1 FecR domain-containing protein [Butyricimonas hominis]